MRIKLGKATITYETTPRFSRGCFCVVVGLPNRYSTFEYIGFGDSAVFDFEGFDLKGCEGGIKGEVLAGRF